MIEWAAHKFHESTLDLRIREIVEAQAVRLRQTANQNAIKGEKLPVYQAVQKFVRQVITRGDIIKAIHLKDDSLAKSQDFVQNFTSILIKNPLFIMANTHLVKQHVQVTVADESNFYGQTVARANQDE